MRPLIATTALSIAMAMLLTGCKPAADEQSAETSTPPAATPAGLPASLFAASAPTDAEPLMAVKSTAKAGDQVVFQARVGGRADAFLENRAVFFVVDPAVKSCDDLHPGRCKKPWDYCCTPADDLLASMATVQVVDADGRPIKQTLHNEHGLDGLTLISVTGTVDQVDDAGNFVVNAESIHVQEG